MKRYPAWQALYRCFYSADFSRDVAANWKEIGFLFLFLLAGLSWAGWAISFQIALAYTCDKFLAPLADQMPTVTSAEGKFSIDKPSPYHVRDLSTGKPIITFDTTGKTTTLDLPGILVTDKDVLLVGSSTPASIPGITTKDSSSSPDSATAESKVFYTAVSDNPGSFSRSDLKNILAFIRTFATPILFVAGWLCGTIFLFLQALLYAIVGLLFASINKAKLSFPKLIRLAALAIAPPLIMETIIRSVEPTFLAELPSWRFGMLPFSISVVTFIALGVSMVYLYLWVFACRHLQTGMAAANGSTAMPNMTPTPTPTSAPSTIPSPAPTAMPSSTPESVAEESSEPSSEPSSGPSSEPDPNQKEDLPPHTPPTT